MLLWRRVLYLDSELKFQADWKASAERDAVLARADVDANDLKSEVAQDSMDATKEEEEIIIKFPPQITPITTTTLSTPGDEQI